MNARSNYREIDVTQEGIPYVQRKLEEGGLTYAKLVMQLIDLERGRAIVLAEKNVELSRVFDFEYDDGPGAAAESWIVWRARQFLRSTKGGIIIGEHANAERRDPWIERYPYRHRVAFFNNEVYHLALSGDHNLLIRRAIREGNSLWTHIGAMTSASPPVVEAARRGVLTQEGLVKMAQRTERLFLGIYDDLGYLIWMNE